MAFARLENARCGEILPGDALLTLRKTTETKTIRREEEGKGTPRKRNTRRGILTVRKEKEKEEEERKEEQANVEQGRVEQGRLEY